MAYKFTHEDRVRGAKAVNARRTAKQRKEAARRAILSRWGKPEHAPLPKLDDGGLEKFHMECSRLPGKLVIDGGQHGRFRVWYMRTDLGAPGALVLVDGEYVPDSLIFE